MEHFLWMSIALRTLFILTHLSHCQHYSSYYYFFFSLINLADVETKIQGG